MNSILLNLLFGILVIPALLFLIAVGLVEHRSRRGLQPIPPDKVSLIVILGSLASWIVTGINILTSLLAR